MLTSLLESITHLKNNEILTNTMDYSFRSYSNQAKFFGADEWDDEPVENENDVESEDEFVGVESVNALEPDTKEIYKWKSTSFNARSYQVSYLFIIFLNSICLFRTRDSGQISKIFSLTKTRG